MEIQINAKYRIVSDPMNVIVQELKTPKATEENPNPEPKWVNAVAPYNSTLEQACQSILNREINLSEADTVTALIKMMETIREDINAACRDYIKATAAYKEGERVAV